MLPPRFHLTLDARLEGDRLLGGEPFALIRLGAAQARQIRAWRDGAPVGEHGALARALVAANLAQPIPPDGPPPPVTAVIPVRNRPAQLARLLAAIDVAETIVVDDASDTDLRPIAERAGARYIRQRTRGGAGAARNAGLAAAGHEHVALLDSDCVPRPGWLAPLLAHFADPELTVIAPRIVALPAHGSLARYEARRSPLDRGPHAARVLPHGRVPFVPGTALLVKRHVRFDETLKGGEDVDLSWRAPYVRYEPASQVAHEHRTTPRAWLARRVYYGRTAAPLAQRHPGNARPLPVSPWTTAAWLALGARRPAVAAAITATATGLLARELPPALAAELVIGGGARSGRAVANALTRHWWPLAPLAPKHFALAALATGHPLALLDDLAYGYGVWRGCLEHRTVDPLLPARPWRLVRHTGAPWG